MLIVKYLHITPVLQYLLQVLKYIIRVLQYIIPVLQYIVRVLHNSTNDRIGMLQYEKYEDTYSFVFSNRILLQYTIGIGES